jgi:serine/threonine-protein kinase
MDETDAVIMLTELGLKVGEITQINSDTVEKDKICQQSVAEGNYVDEGTKIDFAVSLGKANVTYKYEANISAPSTAEAPDYVAGTSVHIVVTTADGKTLIDVSTTNFPFTGNYYGISAATGTITMSYEVVTPAVTQKNEDGTEVVVTPESKQTKTFTRSIEFVQE